MGYHSIVRVNSDGNLIKVIGPLGMPVILPIQYIKEKFIYSSGNGSLI